MARKINTNFNELTSDLITTKSDKAIMFEALSLLKDSAYMNDSSKFLQKIKDSVPISFFEPLAALISQSNDPKELSNNAVELEKFINKLPVIHLTIGYEPTRNQLEQLANKIKEKLSTQTILDYSIIHNFLGLKIEFNGKIYKKTIDTELAS